MYNIRSILHNRTIYYIINMYKVIYNIQYRILKINRIYSYPGKQISLPNFCALEGVGNIFTCGGILWNCGFDNQCWETRGVIIDVFEINLDGRYGLQLPVRGRYPQGPTGMTRRSITVQRLVNNNGRNL